jgi:hypothetical protein
MTKRPAELQNFLDCVHDEFKASKLGPEAKRCIGKVFDALKSPKALAEGDPVRLPACAHLADALETVRAGGASLAKIAASFAALEPSLTWYRRGDGGDKASANFADQHANAMIAGPRGLELRDDVWVGASLLSPHVRYPDHNHAPEEVYLVLSKGRFRQDENEWFEPGMGGTFYNRPNIRHAMASGDKPLFAIWCLAR